MAEFCRPAARKVDRLFRRTDTQLARTINRIQDTNYLHSKTKRNLDVGVSITIFPLVASTVVGLAVVNKLLYPKDPAFFIQERLGHNGKKFLLRKIRTMKPNSDFEQTGVDAHKGIAWKNPHNTRFGSVLRRYDVDELPQITQVITGELSLVGIRPAAPAVDRYLERTWPPERFNEWNRIYRTTPLGISHMSAIFTSRTKEDKKRFRFDKFYAEHASLGLDLYLLWRTFTKVTKLLR